ncbi:hypothetical protein ACHAXS_001150 [Conticribra weissflogii]
MNVAGRILNEKIIIKLDSAVTDTASRHLNKILPCNLVAQFTHHRTSSWNRPFSSTSIPSFTIEGCPHRTFAKNHPEIARKILTVPPYSFTDYSFASLADLSHHVSLEKYLNWRGWNIDKILSGFETTDSKIAQSAIGLLSHPLTFPLTLGYHSKFFVPQNKVTSPFSEPQSSNRGKKRAMRLCCVGARAECTLPDVYWREFLIMSSAMIRVRSIDAEEHKDGEILEWIFDFIGPEVPRQIKTKTINLFDDSEDCKDRHIRQHQAQRPNLVMNYHASYLHDVILRLLKSIPQTENRTEQIRQIWDGFVLFNPGLGHPNLEKQWKPAIEFLLSTGKPILFTAHSALDAERDALTLTEYLTRENYLDSSHLRESSYEDNPFSSRMKFVDPFPKAAKGNCGDVHVVRPNHSVYFLHRAAYDNI